MVPDSFWSRETNWYEAKRYTLRHDPKGVGRVIDAPALLRKGRDSAEIRRTLGYFHNDRSRMNYFHVAKDGYPIGSGEVEAANKVLMTQRLKRFGKRWGREGAFPAWRIYHHRKFSPRLRP